MIVATSVQNDSGCRFGNWFQEKRDMAFVNEKISAEDAEKYGIDEVNKDFIMGPGAVRLWTIDRKKMFIFVG